MKQYNITFRGYRRDTDRDMLPTFSGIYLVYCYSEHGAGKEATLNRLIYVGKAFNIRDEICDEKNGLEFYVSFFDEDYNYGKYGKLPDYDSEKMRMKKVEYNNPQVTFKLSHKGIELVPIIPVKKMKWAFKCNKKLYGKEYKRWSLVWTVERLFRNLQEKFFYNDWVAWHDYTLWGGLDSVYTRSERHFTIDQTIRMLQMWQDDCCERRKENKE
jgi:hypothetical protein